MCVDAQSNARFTGSGVQVLAVAPDSVHSQLPRGIRVTKGTEGSDCSSFLQCFLWKEQILGNCLCKMFEEII